MSIIFKKNMTKSHADEEELKRDLKPIVLAIQKKLLTEYPNFSRYQERLLKLAHGIAAFDYPNLEEKRIIEIQDAALKEYGITREQVSSFIQEVAEAHRETLERIAKFQETVVPSPYQGGISSGLKK